MFFLPILITSFDYERVFVSISSPNLNTANTSSRTFLRYRHVVSKKMASREASMGFRHGQKLYKDDGSLSHSTAGEELICSGEIKTVINVSLGV